MKTLKSLAELAEQHPRMQKPAAYLEAYERHFGPRRADIKSVLEVGVGTGASLRLWRDYFYNAHITGLDIDRQTQFAEPQIEVVIGDICDVHALQGMNFRGRFDVIIDDGGHKSSQIKAGLKNLHPLLMPGGFYCIEDLGTQVWENHAEYRDEDPDGLAHLLQMVRELQDMPKDEPPPFSEYSFTHGLVIMRR